MKVIIPAMTQTINIDTAEVERWTHNLDVEAEVLPNEADDNGDTILSFTYAGATYTVYQKDVVALI